MRRDIRHSQASMHDLLVLLKLCCCWFGKLRHSFGRSLWVCTRLEYSFVTISQNQETCWADLFRESLHEREYSSWYMLLSTCWLHSHRMLWHDQGLWFHCEFFWKMQISRKTNMRAPGLQSGMPKEQGKRCRGSMEVF